MDVSNWLRPDAPTSPELLFCHVYGRGRSADQFIPGRPYSFVAALETGRTSWTALPAAIRLGPCDDATAVTATQLREVVTRLVHAGQWRPGDAASSSSWTPATTSPASLTSWPTCPSSRSAGSARTASCSGMPAHTALPHAADSPASTAVSSPSPSRSPGIPLTRPRRATPRATAWPKLAWDRMHPRLQARGPWLDHCGELPLIHDTLIRLKVEHLPGDRDPKPVWQCSSRTSMTGEDVDLRRQAFLRRFDHEHTFRLFKQTDLWTWLITAAHTQLRLARPLAEDLRRPWERPPQPLRLTPARVRRGFRHLRVNTARPADVPRPSKPGPGRPLGSKNAGPPHVTSRGRSWSESKPAPNTSA